MSQTQVPRIDRVHVLLIFCPWMTEVMATVEVEVEAGTVQTSKKPEAVHPSKRQETLIPITAATGCCSKRQLLQKAKKVEEGLTS